MNIAGHEIGKEPFLIAEASINHNGSIVRAMEMITVAKNAGCDAIKFQAFKATDVCPPDQLYTYRSQGEMITEPRINIFKRCELPDTAWPVLKAECDKQGILFMATPETPADLDMLLKVGIPAIKIGSDNLTNLPMLYRCAKDDVGLPVILSCGMSDLNEVARAISIMPRGNVAMLVCASIYPTPAQYANISRIRTLQALFSRTPIGFSDHSIGSTAPIMAVAMGACILETHFTLGNELAGPEHWWVKSPADLMKWVDDIRRAKTMMGNGVVEPSVLESEVKGKYQRSIA